MKYKYVCVDWVDTCSRGTWRYSPEDKKVDTAPCRSIGAVIHRDGKAITLAQTHSRDADGILDLVTIPMGCVERITRISVPERKKR